MIWSDITTAPQSPHKQILGHWIDDGLDCYRVVCWQRLDFDTHDCGWLPPEHGGEREHQVFPTQWAEIEGPKCPQQ